MNRGSDEDQDYLQNHFNSKDTGEDVVKVGENSVPSTLLLHRVLGGQGDGAEDDDDHDESVEEREGDHGVNCQPEPIIRPETEH